MRQMRWTVSVQRDCEVNGIWPLPSDSYVRLTGEAIRWPPAKPVDYDDYFELLREPHHFEILRRDIRDRVVRRAFELAARRRAASRQRKIAKR